jgi:hypothetical protein
MESYLSVPETILKVAFQPTARGGETHFVAGNIRLVSAARDLLDTDACEDIATGAWMVAHRLELGGENEDDNDVWRAWLEDKYHIDDNQRGNIQEEQLLVEGQQMYACPVCLSETQL